MVISAGSRILHRKNRVPQATSAAVPRMAAQQVSNGSKVQASIWLNATNFDRSLPVSKSA